MCCSQSFFFLRKTKIKLKKKPLSPTQVKYIYIYWVEDDVELLLFFSD